MDYDVIWSKLLEQIKTELSTISYSTWFQDTKLYKLENDKAYIIVTMLIHKKHLMDNYSDLIINNLQKLTDNTYELCFLLNEEIQEEEMKQQEKN